MTDKPSSGQTPDRKRKKAKKPAAKTRKNPKKAPKKPNSATNPVPKDKTTAQTYAELPEEADPKQPLTERQKAFVEGYLLNRSVRKGALYAGCSEGSAAAQGTKWLRNPKIKVYLEKRRREHFAERNLHENELVEFLLDVVRFNPGDYLEWDAGQGVMRFRRDVDMAEALRFIQVDTSCMDASGENGYSHARGFKVQVKDQMKAVELLMKVGGWLENKRPGDDRGGLQSAMERLAARIRGGKG